MAESAQLFDLSGKEHNPYWVDPKQPLLIPNQPLHMKAHRLQVLLNILDKQAEKNAAQFNSKNYLDTLNEYTRVVTLINSGHLVDPEEKSQADGTNDKGAVGTDGNPGATPEMGNPTPPSVDIGISADNPFAGAGLHPVRAVSVPARVPELSGSVPSDK